MCVTPFGDNYGSTYVQHVASSNAKDAVPVMHLGGRRLEVETVGIGVMFDKHIGDALIF